MIWKEISQFLNLIEIKWQFIWFIIYFGIFPHFFGMAAIQ
jgi:hypothetical protein